MEISDMDRGHIKIKDGLRSVSINAEMFFPRDDQLGFTLYMSSAKSWTTPNGDKPLNAYERMILVSFLRDEFAKENRVLEFVD